MGRKLLAGVMVRLWDVDTGKVIAKSTGRYRRVWSICWSRDGTRVVSGGDRGRVRVWDVESGKTVLAIETGLSSVGAVICSPDTTMIATGGDSREGEVYIKIWDRFAMSLPARQTRRKSQRTH
jgi:WD40 repeat protein